MINVTDILRNIVASSAKVTLARSPGEQQAHDMELDGHLLKLSDELAKLPHDRLEQVAEGHMTEILGSI